MQVRLTHDDGSLREQPYEYGRVSLRPELAERPRPIRRRERRGVHAVLYGDRESMQEAQTSTGRARLISRAGRVEHRLTIEDAKGVQAFETLRAIEQGAGIVFRLDLAVSHPRDSRGSSQVGEFSRRVDSGRSTCRTSRPTGKTDVCTRNCRRLTFHFMKTRSPGDVSTSARPTRLEASSGIGSNTRYRRCRVLQFAADPPRSRSPIHGPDRR